MKTIRLAALSLLLASCSTSASFRVTAYRTVSGDEAAPWPYGCLVTAESRARKVIGWRGAPCERINIGDKVVFDHEGDTLFYVNGTPYQVRSTEFR